MSDKDSLTSITYNKKIPDYTPKDPVNKTEKIPTKLPVVTTLSTSTGVIDPLQLPSVKAAKAKGAPVSVFIHQKNNLGNVNKEILIAIITWLDKHKEHDWTEVSERISKTLATYQTKFLRQQTCSLPF